MTQLNLSHFEFYPFHLSKFETTQTHTQFFERERSLSGFKVGASINWCWAVDSRYLAIRERGLPALNITKKTPFLLGFSFVGDAYTQNEFLFKFWLKLGLKKMVRTGDALNQTKVLFDKIENWS